MIDWLRRLFIRNSLIVTPKSTIIISTLLFKPKINIQHNKYTNIQGYSSDTIIVDEFSKEATQ